MNKSNDERSAARTSYPLTLTFSRRERALLHPFLPGLSIFWEALDTAPEKTGPTRGERIFSSFSRDSEPFTPSSRLLLAAYRGADLFIDTPSQERAGVR